MTREQRVRLVATAILLTTAGCQAGGPVLPGEMVGAGNEVSSLETEPASLPVEPPSLPDARAGASEGTARVLERYLQLTDLITTDGGGGPDRVREVVTEDWYPIEDRGFAEYREGGFRTLGVTTVDTITLSSARWTPESTLEVHAVACVDASRVWVLDQDAADPPDDLMQWLLTSPAPEMTDEPTLEAWQVYLEQASPRIGRREPVSFWLTGEGAGSLRIDQAENWVGVDPCTLEQEEIPQ